MIDKIKAYVSLKRLASLVGLLFLIVLTQSYGVEAQTITQGYSSENTLQRATIVSLKQDDPRSVEPASLDNHDRMHGVVVSANDAPFTLSTEDERTFVATTGRFEAFVSNENGVIQPGDFIAISRVAGIGMKAQENDVYIVGKALAAFDGQNSVLSTSKVDDAGEERSVSIGRILIEVGVAGNPLLKATRANLPSFLERLAENIAQKPVNTVRIYIGLTVFFATATVAATLLYSGVRSSVISVGRNPLSKKSITKSLLQIILTSMIILLLGVFAVYLILRV